MTARTLQRVIPSIPAFDGGGVKLRRSLGQSQLHRVDPFLMLDEISSDDPDDYIAGFPSHPHRGFETVTYMLEGHMLHEDHLGHRGDLRSGGAQWMTAGRGIIHSEMPQQIDGHLWGFQLWINLPGKEKMKPASYRDIQPEEIPQVALTGGGLVKVLAGKLETESRSTAGPIQGLSTAPLFIDVRLPAGKAFSLAVEMEHSSFVYPYVGSLSLNAAEQIHALQTHSACILSRGNRIDLIAGDDGAGFLLLAARPLGEPIAQYGPFVMNTKAEIEQAISDYQNGNLAQA